MIEKGLEPGFSRDALDELDHIRGPAPVNSNGMPDWRNRLWVSIDNDDSRDLDQLTYAEPLPGGSTRIFVAIADVDALVAKGTAIDVHARTNTTSVYTAAEIFPMLPEKLSTGFTSLNEGEDRLAVVVTMTVEKDGSLGECTLQRAAVRNHAKLAYDSVSVGLEGGEFPEKAVRVDGVVAQLRLQDAAAQLLRGRREEEGALDLETIEPRAVFENDAIVDLALQPKNRARELIEDFMIAANGATARFLAGKGFASLRRVVRSPERWQKIVAVAAENSASASRPSRTAARSRSFSANAERRTRSAFRISPSSSSSSWARASTSSSGPGRLRSGTSASPCATTPTRPRRTGAFPT